MSKVFKGIGKAIKGVVKGIGRVFKKIASSTVGKVLLAGAAIWLGGAALGMWNSPFASINGAIAGGSTATTSVAPATLGTAGTTGTTTVAGATGGVAGAATGTLPVLEGAAVGNISSAGPIAEMWGTAGTAGQNAALKTAVTETGKAATNTMMANITKQAPSLLQRAITGVGNAAKWAEEHETLTTMGTFGLASALSPDETDIMRERERIRQDTYDRNLSVGGVNLGMNPSGKPLTDRYGNPLYSKLGLLNRTGGGA